VRSKAVFCHRVIVRCSKIIVSSFSQLICCFSFQLSMECRLVLNNRSHVEITDTDLKGILHQQLKYFKFRRLPSKTGRTIVYLFFRKEEETYCALRAAKSMRHISLVRYRPATPVCLEPVFHPFPPQSTIDLVRYAFRDRLKRFTNVVREPR
jgi:hypothetical protein